uniref:Uncharacterized protein n=1 Tax=Arundo donax TaxID=35708 RepID=A0A0A8YLL0_ARUDO
MLREPNWRNGFRRERLLRPWLRLPRIPEASSRRRSDSESGGFRFRRSPPEPSRDF